MDFTSKQKEIVARKLGYDGPMQGFDEYLNSSPALQATYNAVTQKYVERMANGGVVKRFVNGGLTIESGLETKDEAYKANYYKGLREQGYTDSDIRSAIDTQYGKQTDSDWSYLQGKAGYGNDGGGDVSSTEPNAWMPTIESDPEWLKWNSDVENYVNATPEGKRYNEAMSKLDAFKAANPNVGSYSGYGADPALKAQYDAIYKEYNEATKPYFNAQQQFTYTPGTPFTAPGTSTKTTTPTTTTASTGAVPTSNAYFAANPDVAAAYAQNNYGMTPDEFAAYHYEHYGSRPEEQRAPPTTTTANTGIVFGADFQSKSAAEKAAYYNQLRSQGYSDADIRSAADTQFGKQTDSDWSYLQGKASYGDDGGGSYTPPTNFTTASDSTTPQMNVTGTTYSAGTTDITDKMTVADKQAAKSAGQATATTVGSVNTVAAPDKITADTISAAKSEENIKTALANVSAEQGTVSDKALATAATQEPTTTAIANIQAAQGTAAQVEGAPTRTVQEGEMISGPAVDQARVEQTLAQNVAEQGVVTEEMTTQGQLNKIMQDFDAGSPPPWAAASMRAATAQMAARGLGASSLAGQAIIQAALEAAVPIASADAKVFETMGLTNLSNRQAMAITTAEQRAKFLDQEFDQAFQTRVLNAARIADIADKNFDAQTQIAIENATLTNSMNIANLSAENAVVLAKAAQIANLETANLNNRQQVAVENAKAFLQMDIKNLDNRQATMLFKAQQISDAILADTAAENAARATNAVNKLEADKVNATLALTAAQFNASERNKVAIANMDATNEIAKLNVQQQNAREEFNANLATQINVANAKIIADVSTANTAAINAANAVNAKNVTDLSAAAYAQQSQTYRDLLEMSWKTGESEKDRVTEIAKTTITANASANAAEIKADADSSANWGKLAFDVVKNWDSVKDFLS